VATVVPVVAETPRLAPELVAQTEAAAIVATQNEAPAAELGATPETARQPVQIHQTDRDYFVRLTADGLIPGRIQFVDGRSRGLIPARRMTISFVQAQKVISEARPGIDGYFQATRLQPGYYTVVASGQDGVLTFGLEVQPAVPAERHPAAGRAKDDLRTLIESDDARDAQSFLRIDAVLVPPRDIPVVRQVIQPYLGRRGPSHHPLTGSMTRPIPPRTTQFVSAEKIAQLPKNTTQGSWANSLRLPVFYLHSDGTIGGRLTRFSPDVANRDVHGRIPLASGSVFFVRNGVVIDQTTTDQNGRFTVRGIRVGDYTFVAAGANGVAAFGVSVMPHSRDAANDVPGASVRTVSSIRLAQQGAGAGDVGTFDLNVDTSDPNDVGSQNMFGNFGDGTDVAGAGTGAGSGAGGGGGGGGGFGAGGGLGLLGLGGLAGLAGLAGNNNNAPIASTGTTH